MQGRSHCPREADSAKGITVGHNPLRFVLTEFCHQVEMSDGNGRINRQARSAQERPAAPNVIDWLSQQEPPASVRISQCSIAKFYHACTLRLAHVWKRIQSVSAWSKDDKVHLRETFGRFHLWGKGLPLDLLDSADDQFEETRKLVLELLCNISRLLSSGTTTQRHSRLLSLANMM